jgi:hypothetical protein
LINIVAICTTETTPKVNPDSQQTRLCKNATSCTNYAEKKGCEVSLIIVYPEEEINAPSPIEARKCPAEGSIAIAQRLRVPTRVSIPSTHGIPYHVQPKI